MPLHKHMLIRKNFLKKVVANSNSLCYILSCVVNTDAPLAQLVEHLTLNQGVQGSSP